ncbi:phenylacetaldoxime dehydratase [Azorhizobium oxalatiphilum]|uniref:Phenylacetaldoxime dehydratase n=1 Tax=Azorhizobium oxalatiphilum TaxID=980631 RepID=A0A917C420_9HYPH|nr:phenylacetaldoxime dehydratase family protein [Azorhizobium oxalatiphilum]GGF69733.1 phenylacetaldoxime dehydratase [Azorhizobium oxalatiphilum]
MVFHVSYPRLLPERRPPGHQPAAPRFSLRWDDPVPFLTSDYFGLQGQDLGWSEQSAFFERLRASFSEHGPDAHEIMRTTDEHGAINAILVAYWLDPTRHARWLAASPFMVWFRDPARETEAHGIWRETIAVPYDRHETIYSAPGYAIGLARTPKASRQPITMNGYFGAARDRMPVSAVDALESPLGTTLPPRRLPQSAGRRLRTSTPLNMIAIRSGQYWEGAGAEQLADYHDNLQPKLMRGMQHLVEHPQETGTLSLRIMTNLNEDGSPRAETSVLAHVLDLSQLEAWARSHETHLDIYRHAIAMNRLHKEKREVVTWHEVFALLPGLTGEYVNCHCGTGLLPYFAEA